MIFRTKFIEDINEIIRKAIFIKDPKPNAYYKIPN